MFAREDALNEHLHQEHSWPRVKRSVENQEKEVGRLKDRR